MSRYRYRYASISIYRIKISISHNIDIASLCDIHIASISISHSNIDIAYRYRTSHNIDIAYRIISISHACEISIVGVSNNGNKMSQMTNINWTTYETGVIDMFLLVHHSLILFVFGVRRLAVLLVLNELLSYWREREMPPRTKDFIIPEPFSLRY